MRAIRSRTALFVSLCMAKAKLDSLFTVLRSRQEASALAGGAVLCTSAVVWA